MSLTHNRFVIAWLSFATHAPDPTTVPGFENEYLTTLLMFHIIPLTYPLLSSVNIVKGEIHNVLWLMKTNRRWVSTLRFKQEIPLQLEDPLTRNFKALHEHLLAFHDIAEVDTLRFLKPFLAVISAHQANSEITAAALSSIDKFLLYGFIQAEVMKSRSLSSTRPWATQDVAQGNNSTLVTN